MTRPRPARPPARRAPPARAPVLAQQEAAFTAEGAPPPGWVADAPPVTPKDADEQRSDSKTRPALKPRG